MRGPSRAAVRRSTVTDATRDVAAVVSSGGCGARRKWAALLQHMHRELGLYVCGGGLPAGGSRERQLHGRVRRLSCWDLLYATSRRGRAKSFSFSSLLGCTFSSILSEVLASFFPFPCWYGRDAAGTCLRTWQGAVFFIQTLVLLFHPWSCCRSVCFVPVHTCITDGDADMGAPPGC